MLRNLRKRGYFLKITSKIICIAKFIGHTFVKIKHMKKFTILTAVVFSIISLNSCRQPDEALSPMESATLKKIQDSSNAAQAPKDDDSSNLEADGELLPPPKK